MGIEATLAALFVLQRVVHHGAVARANATDSAEPLLAAEQLLADLQALLAVLVADQLWRLITELRIHVVIPESQRLQYVSVGIDDIQSSTHGPSPLFCLV